MKEFKERYPILAKVKAGDKLIVMDSSMFFSEIVEYKLREIDEVYSNGEIRMWNAIFKPYGEARYQGFVGNKKCDLYPIIKENKKVINNYLKSIQYIFRDLRKEVNNIIELTKEDN